MPSLTRIRYSGYRMYVRCQAVILYAAIFSALAQAKNFDGAEALAFTGHAVAFGARPDGSAAIGKLRAYIHHELAARGCEVTADKFTANTPDGPVPMENIIAKFPGKSGRAIAITGHYDTKKLANFVGANDGGSSTGFLLELASVLQGQPRTDDLYLVFFDGEEAIHEWSGTDSLYGSRHLAEKWTADGTIARLKALINIDMIGDKNLSFWDDEFRGFAAHRCSGTRRMRLDTAFFPRQGGAIEDDHIPFIDAGVRSLD